MTAAQNDGAPALQEEGRFWIEILSWDWNLSVALSSEQTPVEHRFQGGLNYVRSFELRGQVVAPQRLSDRSIRIWISPFDADMRFGPDEMDEVGRLYLARSAVLDKADWSATLMLPEDSVTALATCLSSVSKFLFVRVFDIRDAEASIDHYAFSSALPHGVDAGAPSAER